MASSAATHFLQFRIQYSSIALLYYDYALTFPMEVKYIWGQKFRLSTALYIFCRYALVANVLYLLAIAKKLHQSCDTWYKLIGALSVLGRAAVIATFTLRTYAVFARSRIILVLFGIIGLACVGLDILHVPGLRCVGSSSIPIANNLLSIFMCIFEFASAILTTFRSVQALKVGGPWKSQKKSFIYLVFEQGLLYFSVVSLFTTGAVILNYRAPAGFLQRLLNALTLPLSGLLTARFLLHLRAWEDSHDAVGSTASGIDPDNQRQVLSGFQAASRVLSSTIGDFGEDPVRRAVRDQGGDGAGSRGRRRDWGADSGNETTSSLGGDGMQRAPPESNVFVIEKGKAPENVGV